MGRWASAGIRGTGRGRADAGQWPPAAPWVCGDGEEPAVTETIAGPAVAGFHHFSPTVSAPVPYSVPVFRDPGNIQLELIYMAG